MLPSSGIAELASASLLFYSILFYSILFYSILFYSILFPSIIGVVRVVGTKKSLYQSVMPVMPPASSLPSAPSCRLMQTIADARQKATKSPAQLHYRCPQRPGPSNTLPTRLGNAAPLVHERWWHTPSDLLGQIKAEDLQHVSMTRCTNARHLPLFMCGVLHSFAFCSAVKASKVPFMLTSP